MKRKILLWVVVMLMSGIFALPKTAFTRDERNYNGSQLQGRWYCRVPSDSEHGISESKMAIGRRENLPGGRDGQTESMERREALPDRERGAEPKGASGTNR